MQLTVEHGSGHGGALIPCWGTSEELSTLESGIGSALKI